MNLTRALGSVGGLTLVSRILGLARDMLFAQFVGANFASDAFTIAWRMPNMFRALFAEGAFSAAFIPMFNKKVADRDGPGLSAGVDFAQDALSVLLPALVVMTVVLEVFAWPATYLISGGFNGVSEDKFAFAVTLSRITAVMVDLGEAQILERQVPHPSRVPHPRPSRPPAPVPEVRGVALPAYTSTISGVHERPRYLPGCGCGERLSTPRVQPVNTEAPQLHVAPVVRSAKWPCVYGSASV